MATVIEQVAVPEFGADQEHTRDYTELRILDQSIIRLLVLERHSWGADHHDEVWNGVYIMSPLASNNHQDLLSTLTYIFYGLASVLGGKCYPGANISNLETGWKRNFRVPDLVVNLPGNPIVDCGTHFQGGPDFLVEILSPGDRAVEKLPFYAELGVREVLHVDTTTRATSLFRLQDSQLQQVGESTASNNQALTSAVLPLTFRVSHSQLTISHGQQEWVV